MVGLYGRAGSLTAENGGSRPEQYAASPLAPFVSAGNAYRCHEKYLASKSRKVDRQWVRGRDDAATVREITSRDAGKRTRARPAPGATVILVPPCVFHSRFSMQHIHEGGAALCIAPAILYTQYTGWRRNDAYAYAQARSSTPTTASARGARSTGTTPSRGPSTVMISDCRPREGASNTSTHIPIIYRFYLFSALHSLG